MRGIITIALFVIINLSVTCKGYGQRVFVIFETTNQRNDVCQNKTLGVIANVILEDEYKSFEWNGDAENFRTVNNEIAVVNSSTPGEKKLLFTLTLKSDEKLDTTILVKVIPKPKVEITYKSNEIKVSGEKNAEIVMYKWIYNGAIFPDEVKQTIANPKPGKYRVVVTDQNGCTGSSEAITIN